MRIEHRILKSFGLILGLLLAGGLGAVAGEMEINLVRNGEFKPGMDNQGPADWSPAYYKPRTNIYDTGRGDVTFNENGMTLEGPVGLFQFDMFDDVTPAYKFSCRMKTEGNKGASVCMRIHDSKDAYLRNRKTNVWEDLELEVKPNDHYGYCMKIGVPKAPNCPSVP